MSQQDVHSGEDKTKPRGRKYDNWTRGIGTISVTRFGEIWAMFLGVGRIFFWKTSPHDLGAFFPQDRPK
jgi:hypothetical protein